MSNSSLVNYTRISPNKYSPRNHAIDTITIHCYVAQASVESAGEWFSQPSTQASCNYMIGTDGRIILIVEEKDASWCSSNYANDNRAVTIECASDAFEPYAVNDKVWDSLIKLCADICKRNGIEKLVWSTDKNQRMNHLNGCNMTVHRDFKPSKSCPGQYLYERHGQIAEEVNKILNGEKPVDKKGVETMMCLFQIDKKPTVYYFDGQTIKALTNPDQVKILQRIYKDNNGSELPYYQWTGVSPWYMRLKQVLDIAPVKHLP